MQKPLKSPNMDFLPLWDREFIGGMVNELLFEVILVRGAV